MSSRDRSQPAHNLMRDEGRKAGSSETNHSSAPDSMREVIFVVKAVTRLVLIVCACVVLTYGASAASLTTNWRSTDLTTEQCVRHAEAIMQKAGFTILDRSPDNTSDKGAWGSTSDGYILSVRCVESKGIVMFAVAGDDSSRRHDILHLVYDVF